MPHTYDYDMSLLAFKSVVKRTGVTLKSAQTSKPERLLSRDESWVLVPIFNKHLEQIAPMQWREMFSYVLL